MPSQGSSRGSGALPATGGGKGAGLTLKHWHDATLDMQQEEGGLEMI